MAPGVLSRNYQCIVAVCRLLRFASALRLFSPETALRPLLQTLRPDRPSSKKLISPDNRLSPMPRWFSNEAQTSAARFTTLVAKLDYAHKKAGARWTRRPVLAEGATIPPLALSLRECAGAADHFAEQTGGAVGHGGVNGTTPSARMARYGVCGGPWGENISYGHGSAREIVMALIIDDGVRGRGHRQNVFNPAYSVAGAPIGSHTKFGTVCSIDFAASYSNMEAAPASQPRKKPL